MCSKESSLPIVVILIFALFLGCKQEQKTIPSDLEFVEYSLRIVRGRTPSDKVLRSTVALSNPSISRLGYSSCSGTVVHPRFVLTAAHCLQSGNLTIVAWGPQVEDEKTIPILRYHVHEGYTSQPIRNDIGLVELQSALPDELIPVEPYRGALSENTDEMLIAGYGITREDAGLTDTGILREATVYLREVVSDPTPEIVADGNFGEDSCQGDSGGPVFVGNPLQVTGITSWGIGCSGGGHYTDVRAHLEWIQAILPTACN